VGLINVPLLPVVVLAPPTGLVAIVSVVCPTEPVAPVAGTTPAVSVKLTAMGALYGSARI